MTDTRPPGADRAPGTRGRLAPLVAVAPAGALPVLCFPEPSWWWLAPLALVPWLLLLRASGTARAAALRGWIGGTALMLATHHWLLPNLHVFTPVLAALLGALWAPWGWLVWRLLRGVPTAGRAAAAVTLIPCGWLAAEFVRSWEYLGGPWGVLGASQWQLAPARQLASLGGAWLVSLLLVAVNTALALLCAVPGARRAGALALAATAAVVGAAAAWAPAPRQAGTATVALVQPGVLPGPQARFDHAERLTRALADRPPHDRPDLVVWGESGVGFDLAERPDLAERLRALSADVDAPLLVNVDARRADAAEPGEGGIFKSAVLVEPAGVTEQRYDKTRLVPFGEYVPARPLLGWVTGVGEAADQDRRRGERQVLIEVPPLRVGPVVSFESTFPDLTRHLARDGADLLVVQAATSTFQDSWAPEQHAAVAAMRAAETWRPVAHATLTGVSAVHDAHGRPVGPALGTDQRAAHVYRVPLATGTSPYTRFGDWAPWLALGALAAAAARTAAPASSGAWRSGR
ncbi:apolipoprotein N-acyltransferase [Allostreptomyces psammosilenae]|uniref:Apolipoprotein N-acyltransferase n=1 Tax=Allostreptomyces psammosilenae TaxID=1892865 RepID=A0A852ZSL0_9ACTN|nr:apolipoprotein N-acyltransferase [Allostreptomyces psammosilenae]NYI04487.1 apolipoprotein N-acyltransferase [Allostreptomyces psammosilenae]